MSSRATEDLRVELGFLRDNVVQAASQRRTAILEAGLDTYNEVINEFISVLKDFDSPYSRDQALAEMHSISGGWSEIEWVRDDYREIADAALDSDNLSVILPVISFPVRVSGMAYSQREYFIFAQFLGWLRYLYDRSVDRLMPSDFALFAIVRDRLPQYLYELGAYRIGHDLSESPVATDIRKSCDFAREILANFNRLLKAAYDRRRSEDFGKFTSDLLELYRHQEDYVGPSFGDPMGVDATDRSRELEEQPDQVRSDCFRKLFELRQIIFLGLDAWILRDYERGRLDRSEALAFRGSLSVPASISDLWRLSLAVRDERYERELEWTWWESAEHTRRGAYSGIDFSHLVLRAALLRMLVTASPMPYDQVMDLSLPLSRDLDYLVASGSGPLIQELDRLAASDDLQGLVEFTEAGYRAVRDRFMRLGAEESERERVHVIDAPLSSSRVAKLEANIVRGWEDTGALRRLIHRFGRFEDGGEAQADRSSLSMHIFERKDIFIEDSRFDTSMWGEEWGRSLAQGEDRYVIDQIASEARAASDRAYPPQELVDQLDRSLQEVRRLKNPLILLVNSVAGSWSLSDSGRFQYARHLESDAEPPQPSAYFDKCPVYQLYADYEPVAIVTDLAEVGIWKQYRPSQRSPGRLLNEWIYLELEAFDEASATEFLTERQPNALLYTEDQPRRELPLRERINLLRQRVRVLLLEQLEFDVTDPSAARIIKLTE